MLSVFLVTVYLTVSGFVQGPERYMGSTAAELAECEALARQMGFTARAPDPYLGVGMYCEVRLPE